MGVEPTRYYYHQSLSLERLPIPPLSHNGSSNWTRTSDIWINSPPFYRLNYRGILVQMTGFEPATSCSQSRRSTKLSYIWIMVRMEGVEPSRYCYPGILSPIRLPIPSHSHNLIFFCKIYLNLTSLLYQINRYLSSAFLIYFFKKEVKYLYQPYSFIISCIKSFVKHKFF